MCIRDRYCFYVNLRMYNFYWVLILDFSILWDTNTTIFFFSNPFVSQHMWSSHVYLHEFTQIQGGQDCFLISFQVYILHHWGSAMHSCNESQELACRFCSECEPVVDYISRVTSDLIGRANGTEEHPHNLDE